VYATTTNATATPTDPCVKYQFAGLLGNEFLTLRQNTYCLAKHMV